MWFFLNYPSTAIFLYLNLASSKYWLWRAKNTQTPYLMMKNSLAKMNPSWENTAMLMGDSWLKTIIRVVTPNAFPTLIEVFSYYFVNAMVTVSAVIFIAGTRTMVITTKIKELQYFNKYNEIFVLSLLILFTNMICKFIFQKLANKMQRSKKQA